MKKIVVVTPYFFDKTGDALILGGAEKYLADLLEVFEAEGYDYIVYQQSKVAFTQSFNNHPIVGVPVSDATVWGSRKLFDCVMRSEPEGNFYFHSCSLPYRMANGPSIGVCHGVFWQHSNKSGLIREFKKYRDLQNIHNSLKNLDCCVAVDTDFKNYIRTSWYGLHTKVNFLPNYVDTTMFYPPGERDSEKIHIAYPRSISSNRGIKLLCDVIPVILEEHTNVVFHIVGNQGPELAWFKKWYEKYSNDSRVLHYHRSYDEMAEVYRQAHITLVPSLKYEGTSLSCLEAMASGSAVIVSEVSGLANLVINNFNGLMIPSTSEALKTAIKEVICDKGKRECLSNNALAISKTFNKQRWEVAWKKIINKYYHPPVIYFKSLSASPKYAINQQIEINFSKVSPLAFSGVFRKKSKPILEECHNGVLKCIVPFSVDNKKSWIADFCWDVYVRMRLKKKLKEYGFLNHSIMIATNNFEKAFARKLGIQFVSPCEEQI